MENERVALLLIEDDKIDQLAFERLVRMENLPYDYTIAGSMKEAVAVLSRVDFDIVVADYGLGDGTGLDILGQVRDTPVVVVTGVGHEGLAVQAMKAGAHDYLVKDPQGNHLTVLPATVERVLLQRRDELELERYRESLEGLVEERTGALRESEKRLTALIGRLPQGVCILDGERRIVLTNPAARQYLAVLADCREGDILERLGPLALAEALADAPNGVRNEVTVAGPPVRIFKTDARPMREGRPAEGWVLTLDEATHEREVQSRMQQQDRLAAVGQLAAGIAHDFNNMLSVITGLSQMISLDDGVSSSVRGDARSIHQEGQRAAETIRQIMDFSRTSDIERHGMNLVPFVKESVKLLERTLPETMRLETEIDAVSYTVEGSPSQLQQVLSNLVVNGRDAMPDGGVLRIGLSSVRVGHGQNPPCPGLGEGEWVVWRVSDTGVGMSGETLRRIFEPFYTTKVVGEGTGLGLAQVYGLVHQHEGCVDVKSVVGEGTTFTVYLPIIQVGDDIQGEEGEELVRGGGQTVLVVEDNSAVLKTTVAMVRSLGYDVVTATTGTEAMQVYADHGDRVGVVLTDMVMPEMGGLELFEALREQNPEVKVVVMTGYAPEAQARDGLLQEVSGFLQKPLDLEEMGRVLGEAIADSGANSSMFVSQVPGQM
jgi:two-component system, cell cycle sensor histidine kinase and response regulator CckA